MKQTVLLVTLLSLVSRAAFAQSDPNGPDPAKVKIRLGPVIMNPSISLWNVGYDENVFNESVNPKRDFTLTISPKTELWLPFMGTWFTGLIGEDLNWYRQYTSERGTNTTLSLNWKLPLSRLTADLGVGRTSTRERPGSEIDARAQRVLKNYSAAVSFRFLANTSLDVRESREETAFDENTKFLNVNLHDELNRASTTTMIGISQKLTPLTTLSGGISRQQDRFAFDPLRDSDSTLVTAGVSFSPLALLKGGITAGYQNFKPVSKSIPGFTGTTLTADLSYTPLEVTRVGFTAERNVQYSYDTAQPYYVLTRFNVEVGQQIFGPVDLVARGGIGHLDYRSRNDLVTADSDGRADRIVAYGGGVGYHVGRNLRFGFNVDQNRRESSVATRQYERPAYGLSVTYDF